MFLFLISVIEILAAVARFGVMANKERGVVIYKHAHRNFGWGYLLGILGALMQVFTMSFYGILILKQRRKEASKQQYAYNASMNYTMQVQGPNMYHDQTYT